MLYEVITARREQRALDLRVVAEGVERAAEQGDAEVISETTATGPVSYNFV